MSFDVDRQHPPDRLDRPRRVGLPAGAKVEVADARSPGRPCTEDSGGRRRERAADPTISTHVLDTGARDAGGRRPGDALRGSTSATAPIRMTQALTDGDGRVRDLLERPLVAGRLPPRVRRRPATDGAFFTKVAVDLRIARHDPELPRAAPPRAVLDDDVPRAAERGGRSDVAALDALPADAFVAAACAVVRGRAAVPRAGSRPRARSAMPPTLFGRARRDRPGDARGRAARADRRPSAARRAAGDGLRGQSFREQGYDRETTEAIADARAPERRLRGPVRVPVLRLRQRPLAAGAGSRARGGPRPPIATPRSGAPSTTSSRSPATGSPRRPRRRELVR